MTFAGPFNPTGQPGHFLLKGGVHVTFCRCAPEDLAGRYPWQRARALLKVKVVPVPFDQSIHCFEGEKAA